MRCYRVSVALIACLLVSSRAGAQWASIPDSLFEPIQLPAEVSFGYPANTIYIPHIHDLTRRRQFDSLEVIFDRLEEDVSRDVRNEIRLEDAFDAFYRDDSPLLEAVNAWVQGAPQSPHARVARANYHLATAWRRRGGAYLRDTPQENIRGMVESSRKAIEDLTIAFQLDDSHLMAYKIFIEVNQLAGTHEAAIQALSRGVSVHRGSMLLYRAFANMLWPRWGGSDDILIKFGERASQDASTNPRLATLRGIVHQSRAFDSTLEKNLAGAVRELNKAIEFGPERAYVVARGKAYFDLRAYEYAFHDLRFGMIERSQDASTLEYYGRTLVELAAQARPEIRGKVLDRAIETLTLAAYFQPRNANVSAALARARRMKGG